MNKRVFLSFTLSILASLLLFQWIATSLAQPTAVFPSSSLPQPAQQTAVSIQTDSPSQLQFTLHTATAVNNNGLVQIEGLDQRVHIAGEPALPYYSRWIALPPNGTAVVDVQNSVVRSSLQTAVSPATAEQPDIESWAELNGETVPEFYAETAVSTPFKASLYQQNKLYPTVTYDLSEPMHLRDLRLVELRLYPVRYNPMTGAMEQATQMDVTVSITGASEEGVEKRPFTTNSQADAFADHILNYEQSKAWRHFPTAATTDIRLPIGQETFKITLDEDGLYDITPAQIGSINPQNIEMMYRGQPVAYDIVNDNGDAVFDVNERIRFYGWAFDSNSIGNSFAETQFVSDNVYWLWANGNPTRIVHEDNESGHPTVTTFAETLVFAPENTFFSTYTNQWPFENEQDAWYWQKVQQGVADVITKTYPITLPNPIGTGSMITYTAELVSEKKGANAINITYTVRGQLNEYPVQSEVSWYGLGNVDLVGTQPISSLNPLDNTMHIVFASDNSTAVVYVNDITVEYERKLMASANQLFFRQPTGGAHEFTIAGYDEGDAAETAVWDISDPLAPIAIRLAQTDISGSGPYTYAIGQTYGDDARFIATTNANTLAATVTSYTPTNLDPIDGGADWIAITPSIFESRAITLAVHRQNPVYGGYKTAVVDIEDINNQYGYGLPLPEASRAYLTHALANWPTAPRYVTLVGTASHSPRGLPCLSTWCSRAWTTEQATTFIPTNLPFVDRWQGLIPSDFTYATLIGDDLLPDIAVGRLTVNDTTELDAVISKIILYEANLNAGASWINDILFVADDADSGGNFAAANAATAARLPSEYNTFQLEQIENATPADTALLRADMGSYINAPDSGVAILNYRGHGSIQYWSSPSILQTGMDFWNNDDSPLIILSADCLDGYFAYPNLPSLGQDFLTRPFVGTSAHWSSSGLGLTAEHTVLHNGFYDAIFDHHYSSIGDATNYAKVVYAQSSYVTYGESELHSFNLQGDPAMNVVPNRSGELQFEQANSTVMENAGTATITITRTNGRDGAASVHYATSNGTAIAGDDYIAASGTLNFADGEISKTFTITILDDGIIENDKTVNLTLTNVTGASAGSPMQATLTIRNDDATVQFTQSDFTIAENAGTATITISRLGNNDGIISVDYTTEDGTAVSGIDYTAVSGTLTFAASEMSRSFTIPILDDNELEGGETVNLTLSNPTGNASLGNPNPATLTIENDDVTIQFTQSNFNGLESVGEATIAVSRAGNSTGVTTVEYTTQDGTAVSGIDYVAISGTLTFNADELNKTFAISILNDGNAEGNEIVNLLLSNPSDGSMLGDPNQATLTIADDGATFQFAQSHFVVAEDAETAVITLTRAGDLDSAMAVTYATSNGTAIAGIDYEAKSGTITFASGEDTKTFTILILHNNNSQEDTVVNLTLSNPTNGAAVGTPHPAVLTITNVNHVYLPIIIK